VAKHALPGGIPDRADPSHDVVFPATRQHPRFSEGSIIELQSEELLLVYADYYSGGADATTYKEMRSRRTFPSRQAKTDPNILGLAQTTG
jgi:hypothetical protein